MFTSERNNALRLWLIAVAVVLMAGCAGRKSRQQRLREFVERALAERYMEGDYESYMESVDYGTELDTVQTQMILALHRQFADRMEKTHGRVVSVGISDMKAEADTVSFVHYTVTYADSTEQATMMKVVENNGTWRIKSRN